MCESCNCPPALTGRRSHFNQVCVDMMAAEPKCVAYKPGGKAYFARFDTAAKYLAMIKEGQALTNANR